MDIKNGCTRLSNSIASQGTISLRTKDYRWDASHRVCRAHFQGRLLYRSNNIPAILPRKDLKTGKVVWPIDISHLLVGKTSEEDQRNSTVSVYVPKVIEATDEIQMAPESQESLQISGPYVFSVQTLYPLAPQVTSYLSHI